MSTVGTLYPFQVEGVEHLVRRRCVLLADEMGLGKTVQAAVAIRRLFADEAIQRVLIICPYSLCRNWRREMRLWAPELPSVIYEGGDRYGMLMGNARILIGSYETISADLRRATADGAQFSDIGIDLIVLDEAQRIKAPEAVRSRVLSKLVAPRRWAITGTPLENHPRELASILRFLYSNEFSDPGTFGDYELILSCKDLAMLRRTKQKVGLQLPPKRVVDVHVGLSPEQAAEYDSTCGQIKDALHHAADLQAAFSCLLGGLQTLRRIVVISSQGDSSKIDLLEEEMEELAEERQKVIVFSSFAEIVLPVVVNRLKNYGALLYSGSMTAEERECVHEQFIQDPKRMVMCASLRAAGVGLNWVVAAHVYHLDLWWNPQVLHQAEDRAHRIGQNQPVIVKRLLAEDTIEEGIAYLLEAKEDIFNLAIGEGGGTAPSPQSFRSLLELIGLKLTDVGAARHKLHKTH